MMYLIIQTGYEGIEKLCWLTDKKEESLTKREEFIDKEVRHQKDMWQDFPDYRIKTRQEIADFFCIQQWKNNRFDCVCKEVGVKINKLMLR